MKCYNGTRNIYTNIVSVLVLVLFVFFLFNYRSVIQKLLLEISFELIFSYMAAVYFHWLMTAKRDSLIYSSHSCNISIKDVFLVNTRRTLLNFFPMKYGTLEAAAILKKRFGLRYSQYIKSMVFQQSMLVLGGILVYFFLFLDIKCSLEVKWPFLALQLFFLVLACFFYFYQRRLWLASLLSYFVVISTGIRYYFLGENLHSLDIFHSLALGASATFSAFLSITPAGLGVTELFLAITSKIIGSAFEIGFTIALIDRLLSFLFLIINYFVIELRGKLNANF